MLEWQSIAEKNRQHEGYRKEMDQLQDQWLACQKEMQALLSLVNAKNADEFAERVTAHEQHDELKKEWDTVRRDMRLYAGSEPAFQELWKHWKQASTKNGVQPTSITEKKLKTIHPNWESSSVSLAEWKMKLSDWQETRQ